jgi:hypothetical protein
MVPTDGDGTATAYDLFPGTYRIEVHLHHSVYSDGFRYATVAAGEMTTIEIPVRTGDSITGTVVGPSGRPFPFGYVEATSPGLIPDFPILVDANGRFVITGVLSKREYIVRYYPSAPQHLTSQDSFIEIPLPLNHQGLQIKISKENALRWWGGASELIANSLTKSSSPIYKE